MVRFTFFVARNSSALSIQLSRLASSGDLLRWMLRNVARVAVRRLQSPLGVRMWRSDPLVDEVYEFRLYRRNIVPIPKGKVDAPADVGRHLGTLLPDDQHTFSSLRFHKEAHLENDVVARCREALLAKEFIILGKKHDSPKAAL
jgi:hypothetical protein